MGRFSRVWSRLPVMLLALWAATRLTAPAQAAWGLFVAMGTASVLSDASCAADGAGTAVCAALGSASTVIVNRFNGTAWSGWTALPGVATSPASCAAAGAGKVICAVRSPTLTMLAYLWNGTAWSVPLTVGGGGLASQPSCAPLATGQVLCAARATSSKITAARFTGGTWTTGSWITVAPADFAVYSPVDCAADDVGHAICAWLSPGSKTSVREFTANAWSAALNLDGTATNPPICTDAGVGGNVACFARGTDSALYGTPFAGGTFTLSHWTPYGGFGGLVGGYSCSQSGQHAGLIHYDCGIVGLPDNGFWTNDYNGSSWSGWLAHSGSFVGRPACLKLNASVTPGRVMCVLVTSTSLGVSVIGP